jgi:hypothetical protein
MKLKNEPLLKYGSSYSHFGAAQQSNLPECDTVSPAIYPWLCASIYRTKQRTQTVMPGDMYLLQLATALCVEDYFWKT